MKFFTHLVWFVLCTSKVFGLYFSNPLEPDLVDQGFFIPKDFFLGLKAGYQRDMVLDRKLRVKSGVVKGRVDEFQFLMDQGVITLNFLNRLETYGSLGSMNAFVRHRPHVDHRIREYQTSDHLTWGVGGRLLLFNWESATFGIDGKYQRGYPHVKWNSIGGEAFSTGARLLYREWQVGFGVSYEIDFLIPYAAFTYSSARATMKKVKPNMQLGTSRFTMKSREFFGLCLGFSLTPGKYFDINVETQLFSEQGYTLSGNLKF
ncbi:MAG: hypothetical protein L0207_03940 [Chlamydiae bacterium]|nr:hypothetical protein [Chlamydiota bacterium]